MTPLLLLMCAGFRCLAEYYRIGACRQANNKGACWVNTKEDGKERKNTVVLPEDGETAECSLEVFFTGFVCA